MNITNFIRVDIDIKRHFLYACCFTFIATLAQQEFHNNNVYFKSIIFAASCYYRVDNLYGIVHMNN